MPTLICLALLFVSGFFLQVEGQGILPPAKQEAKRVKEALQKHHVSPKPLDDIYSAQVFKQWIEILDPRGLYFTASDIKELSSYKYKIDDDLNGTTWTVLPALSVLYQKRLLKAKSTIAQELSKPLNLKTSEKMVFNTSDTVEFAKSEQELVKRWNKWLRYQTLSKMYSFTKEEKITEAYLATKEADARKKVLASEERAIKKILDYPSGYEAYMSSLFFNVLLFSQDAHSYYMSVTDYQNMQSSLSPDALSFGMDLDEDEFGNIIIERLQPGGPAWKTNQLHKGDMLVYMKWEGKEEMDLSGADVDEVKELLSSSNSSQLQIAVKKANGALNTVLMRKEKIIEGENSVRSFILKGNKKIGYISLPGFYTEWDEKPNSGCANDVAREVVKLKQEGIEGLVFDVRFNGGGSLQEGLDMAGIFINEGPLAIVKTRDEKPMVLKDANRGTVYDGPLLVMVNRQSASASELMAAALQDHKRAVIVGSTTFGKGSGQSILPLDTLYREVDEKGQRNPKSPDWGFSAITYFKLYRITGKSVQRKGLHPDIYLPDIFEWVDYSEAEYATSFPNDSVQKKVYFTPMASRDCKSLDKKSKERQSKKAFFQLFDEEKDQPALGRLDSVSLHYAAFPLQLDERKKWWKEFETLQEKEESPFTIGTTLEEERITKMDAYARQTNEVLTNKMKQDIYLKESYSIMEDMINSSVK